MTQAMTYFVFETKQKSTQQLSKLQSNYKKVYMKNMKTDMVTTWVILCGEIFENLCSHIRVANYFDRKTSRHDKRWRQHGVGLCPFSENFFSFFFYLEMAYFGGFRDAKFNVKNGVPNA